MASPTIWLSLKNAAAYAQPSVAMLQRAFKRGEIPTYRVGGQRLLRFRVQDLDRWLESNKAVTK